MTRSNRATKPLLALISLCLLTTAAFAGEVGYDTTLGEVHAQVTYSYNIQWDETYGALWGQHSQLVLAGPEVLAQVDPSAFTGEQWEYLIAVLEAEGAKAVLIEDPLEENPQIYVPIPSHAEPALAIPSEWQYRAGIWARGGTLQPHCEWRWVANGSEGAGPDCDCIEYQVKCCNNACSWQSFCFYCASSNRGFLEDLYGPDPRWQHVLPFAEIAPGQRLEVEAAQPY